MKKTLDDLIKLDISFLNQKQKLSERRRVELAWFLGYELIHMTYVYVRRDRLELPQIQILFTETTCNYGGIRKWFSCPVCSKRVRVLFGQEFECRKCLNLKYKSQYETDSVRMKRKLDKFKEKRPYLSEQHKPKFMHRKTFYGSKVKCAMLESKYNLMLVKS